MTVEIVKNSFSHIIHKGFLTVKAHVDFILIILLFVFLLGGLDGQVVLTITYSVVRHSSPHADNHLLVSSLFFTYFSGRQEGLFPLTSFNTCEIHAFP